MVRDTMEVILEVAMAEVAMEEATEAVERVAAETSGGTGGHGGRQ